MSFISKNTHIDDSDLYQDYLDNDAKHLPVIYKDDWGIWHPNGIKVFSIADVWIGMYTKAIGINPNDAELYYKRASFYEIRNKQNEAIADYSEAIRLEPDYEDAYLKRSRCYKKAGLHNEAVSDFNEVIRLNPEHACTLALLNGFTTKIVAVGVI